MYGSHLPHCCSILKFRPTFADFAGDIASTLPTIRTDCGEIDERVKAFLSRPIEGEWPYLWLDATYVKARRDHRIVSVAVIIAVAVNTDGRREVLGMTVGDSEAEPFWTGFLRSLRQRGFAA